jgi:hypothetical protein
MLMDLGRFSDATYCLLPTRLRTNLESFGVCISGAAFIEYWAASEVRERAGIWVVATTLLYGLMPLWGPVFYEGTNKVLGMLDASSFLPIAIPGDLPRVAAFFGVIMVTRAAIGSFIASKEVVW